MQFLGWKNYRAQTLEYFDRSSYSFQNNINVYYDLTHALYQKYIHLVVFSQKYRSPTKLLNNMLLSSMQVYCSNIR